MENYAVCKKEAEIAGMRTDIKTIYKRMDEQLSLTKAVYDLAAEIRVMNQRLETIESCQTQLKDDVEELRMAPSKRWNNVVMAIITALVAAVVAYFLGKNNT